MALEQVWDSAGPADTGININININVIQDFLQYQADAKILHETTNEYPYLTHMKIINETNKFLGSERLIESGMFPLKHIIKSHP